MISSFRFIFRVAVKVFLVVLIALPSLSQAENHPAKIPQPYTSNPMVAIVDGEPIIMDDLKTAQIHEAMVQLHEMQSNILKEKVIEKLSRNHPELALDKIPQVTNEDIAEFYKNTPGVKELGSLSQMRVEIRSYLEKVYRMSYIEERYQHAIDKGWATVYLEPPLEFRLIAPVSTAKLWFPDTRSTSRRVFILEFSDFQCPFCKRVQKTLSTLRERYSKEVQFGYRHFPLPFHKDAKILAEAVECARDQGRFWQLQSLIYKNSEKVTGDNVINYARRAGVKNLREFQVCLETNKYRQRVLDDINQGIKLGIQGTPSFILGTYDPETRTVSGEMFSGAVSEEKFVRAIEKYLSVARTEANLIR